MPDDVVARELRKQSLSHMSPDLERDFVRHYVAKTPRFWANELLAQNNEAVDTLLDQHAPTDADCAMRAGGELVSFVGWCSIYPAFFGSFCLPFEKHNWIYALTIAPFVIVHSGRMIQERGKQLLDTRASIDECRTELTNLRWYSRRRSVSETQ